MALDQDPSLWADDVDGPAATDDLVLLGDEHQNAYASPANREGVTPPGLYPEGSLPEVSDRIIVTASMKAAIEEANGRLGDTGKRIRVYSGLQGYELQQAKFAASILFVMGQRYNGMSTLDDFETLPISEQLSISFWADKVGSIADPVEDEAYEAEKKRLEEQRVEGGYIESLIKIYANLGLRDLKVNLVTAGSVHQSGLAVNAGLVDREGRSLPGFGLDGLDSLSRNPFKVEGVQEEARRNLNAFYEAAFASGLNGWYSKEDHDGETGHLGLQSRSVKTENGGLTRPQVLAKAKEQLPNHKF